MKFTCGTNPKGPKANSEKKLNSSSVKRIVTIFLYLSLCVSSAYAIYRIIITPADAVPPFSPRTQADYVLMLVSSGAGMLVMALPSLIEKKFQVVIPDGLTIAFFAFLFAGIFLGEVQNYYHIFRYWDLLLHAFSSGLLAVLGFKLICIFNTWERLDLHLSRFFIAFFGFCIAVTIGIIWEMYEFGVDSSLGMNMQKHLTLAGTPLIGQEALTDTMTDILVNFASALLVSVAGFFSLKKLESVSRVIYNDKLEENR